MVVDLSTHARRYREVRPCKQARRAHDLALRLHTGFDFPRSDRYRGRIRARGAASLPQSGSREGTLQDPPIRANEIAEVPEVVPSRAVRSPH